MLDYQNFNLMPRKSANPTAKDKMNPQANKIARAEIGGTSKVLIDKFINPVRMLACRQSRTLE